MHDARRYRSNAANCLLAAKKAQRQSDRKLQLSMASSWLSLARQDEEMDNLLSIWETADPPSNGSRLGYGFHPFIFSAVAPLTSSS
jgi:hypothetical protein